MTEGEGVVRLLLWQRRQGFVAMAPGRGYSERTGLGWRFFNSRGYLGTVTEGGEVVFEDGFRLADYVRGVAWRGAERG